MIESPYRAPLSTKMDEAGQSTRGRWSCWLNGSMPLRAARRFSPTDALILPAFLWLCVFFIAPIIWMAVRNFSEGGWASYAAILTEPIYRTVMATTLKISVISTLGALIIGYPIAYFLVIASPKARAIVIVLVTIPYWLDYIVRTFSWMVLLGRRGIINDTLLSIGLITEPLPLLYSLFSVSVGMIQVMLPLMILTLYGAFVRIDMRLMLAAQVHGANPLGAFRTIFLPLSLPAVFGASLLVFVTSLGFFITPALLGSPRETMISQTIMSLAADLLDWGAASAASVVLLVISAPLIALYVRFIASQQTGRA